MPITCVMVRFQMIGAAAVKSIVGLSALGIFLAQAVPAVTPVDPLSSIGRLSLDACLITAVGVLWKTIAKKDEAIAEKDQQLMAMIEKMTQTMVLVIEGDKEVRAGMAWLREWVDHGRQPTPRQ